MATIIPAHLANGAGPMAGIRFVEADRSNIVPGSWYLRISDAGQADAIRLLDDRIKVHPHMMAGAVSLDVACDAPNRCSGSDADMALLVKLAYETPGVLYVEEDTFMYSPAWASNAPLDMAADLRADPAFNDTPYAPEKGNWGLQVLAGASLTETGAYRGMGRNGQGVDVYVIGYGVDVAHPQFEGRASILGVHEGPTDTVSTMEAGVIASRDFGVAPRASVISVTVPRGPDGRTPATALYAAGEAIVSAARASGRPAVVYTGLVPQVPACGNAVNLFRYLVLNGGVHGAATGGFWTNGCQGHGAAKDYGAHIVMAGAGLPSGKVAHTGTKDTLAAWAPYGACVHLINPGLNIKTTNTDASVGYLSGPTAAAAFSAGMIANIRSVYPKHTQEQVRSLIMSAAADRDTDLWPGGHMFPHKVPRALDTATACRSYSPVVSDQWCRDTKCHPDYWGMCELSAKGPSKQCVSIQRTIPTSWCAAMGCPDIYASICQWQCAA